MKGQWLILIIGNAPDLITLFDNCGEDCEWMIEQISNFNHALSRLRLRSFDLILLDHNAPGVDPIENLRAVRSASKDAKVILISSEPGEEQVIAALREQAFSYFARPFSVQGLRDSIRQAINIEDWEDGIEMLSDDPDFITLRLRCRLATADRLTGFMQELKIDLPEDDRMHLAMALRELLLNAIEHGGKLDPNERVLVSRVRTLRTVVYHIQDPGPGFRGNELKHAAISNPSGSPAEHMAYRMELGLRPGGFGMLMAKQLVDEVIYNEQGNEVVLIKHLD